MLSDFCHALWDTRIECDTVSSDGYEVCNLISRDKAKKRKGFLAASFVKPVVSVLLSFPFPVDLFALNVNPRVGAQQTRGFEIFSASLKSRTVQNMKPTANCLPNQKTQREGRKYDQEVSTFHSYEYELNVSNVKQKFLNCFVQVLRVQIPEGNVGHFVNPCFPSTSQEFESNILKNGAVNVHKQMLQHGHNLRCISHLLIKITQVHRGSVPCLGTVEIFANPAQKTGKFVMNYASVISLRLKQEEQKACSIFSKKAPLETVPTVHKDVNSEQVAQKRETSVNDCVPEDFIDPITLDIMTLPVLLPSGTTVDHTTLEQHINTERTWGRSASDPFTGLPLGSKVIPNVALKCRIDKFLLSSDVCVSNLGRTVGSTSDHGSTTKLKLDAVKAKTRAKKKETSRHKRTVLDTEQTQTHFKKQKTGVNQSNLPLSDSLDHALEEVLNVRHQPSVHNPNVSVSSLIPTKLNGSETATTHSRELETSMDGPSDGCPHQEHSMTLFQLPCQHIVCRACLTCAVESNQCPNCRRTFDKRNVVRVHSRNTRS